jgi:hypothetical protein
MDSNEQLSGQFEDDKMNGKGTFYHADGSKYTGDMVNNRKEGQGVLVWMDGNRYELSCSQMSCHQCL